jgi:cyclopropane fatty-acyl-phospholipid synthase-like methyltransferase
MSRGLPPPLVPPEAYDEHYYRHVSAGAEAWRASEGAAPDPLYEGALRLAGLRAGEVVVDVGCGRGELLAVALRLGARRAVGIEYAPAAVALARGTLAAASVGSAAEVRLGDARALPLEEASADLVTMLDVVEHLGPSELDAALREARRVLRPGGRLFVHTLPNATVYRVTYRLQRLARPGRRRSWPAQPRNEHELRMHVNEQTVRSLRRALRRAGFARPEVWLGQWVHTTFVPDERAARLYHRLAAHRLTRRLGAGDIWARAER